MKLSSTLTSLFSIASNYKLLLFSLPNIIDQKEKKKFLDIASHLEGFRV
jgi:hypothetical protein